MAAAALSFFFLFSSAAFSPPKPCGKLLALACTADESLNSTGAPDGACGVAAGVVLKRSVLESAGGATDGLGWTDAPEKLMAPMVPPMDAPDEVGAEKIVGRAIELCIEEEVGTGECRAGEDQGFTGVREGLGVYATGRGVRDSDLF